MRKYFNHKFVSFSLTTSKAKHPSLHRYTVTQQQQQQQNVKSKPSICLSTHSNTCFSTYLYSVGTIRWNQLNSLIVTLSYTYNIITIKPSSSSSPPPYHHHHHHRRRGRRGRSKELVKQNDVASEPSDNINCAPFQWSALPSRKYNVLRCVS